MNALAQRTSSLWVLAMIRKIRRSGPSIDLSKGGKSQRNWGAVSIGRGGGGGEGEVEYYVNIVLSTESTM